MPQSTSRVGKRGTVVIPAALRRRFGIEEGSLIIIAEVGKRAYLSGLPRRFPGNLHSGEEGGVFALGRRGRRGLRARQRRGP
jgi:AbrB family looped-hinge helix DNA binding protein